ncbi:hypothetical protein Pan216_24480 [Planctomycetes bacterium Pan216]|uniref:DUF1802 domain-containing protein n=1 Tax=Kolteria novifilia TaxID=2527975 RepID=A0A518B3N7_9BACT|nr:hypothetical protein Pan216_24480 [Planctomycetes bacterium Pan216]
MSSTNSVAFKEWAVIVAALAQGVQSIILRKGGIQEGREGFRVDHDAFWLFPTFLHQRLESLTPAARPLWDRVVSPTRDESTIPLACFARVEQVVHLESEDQAHSLAGQHLWTEETVIERFHYRRPGLFAILVRTFALDAPHVIDDDPSFAGCRSWVPLPAELSTEGLTPVISDEVHSKRRQAFDGAFATRSR